MPMMMSSPSALEDREALLQEVRQHTRQQKHQQHDNRNYGYLTDNVDNSDNNCFSPEEGGETTHPGTAGTAISTTGGTDEGTDDDVVGVGDEICKRLQENLTLLDHIYPKCKVDLLLVESDEFCPALVAQLSRDLGIQPSFMFIRWLVTYPVFHTNPFLYALPFFTNPLSLFMLNLQSWIQLPVQSRRIRRGENHHAVDGINRLVVFLVLIRAQ